MAAQPIKGLKGEAIPACYLLAKSLGSNSFLACNAVKILPVKEHTKAQKDEEKEGRDLSGSLA